MAIVLNNLGFTLLELRGYSAARSYLVESLRLSLMIGTLPVALETLVGIAHLHVRCGELREAGLLLGTATSHPAANIEVHMQAERALAELRPLLPVADLDALLAEGRARHLGAVASGLLGEGGSSLPQQPR
jgi:hypothetical protein